jgi:glycosyltransferase involved in cell wall biosynthesis
MGKQDCDGMNRAAGKPVVSICCDAYNHEKYIADAIEGFLSQQADFPNEILIHDDASTDGTADIIRRYRHKYPQLIKPVFQTQNQDSRGIKPGRFNFERARGDFIAICQGDDYWTDPLKLQKQVEFLQANENYPMCFTDFSRVNERGGILLHGGVKEAMKTDITQWEVINGHTLKYMTIVFRRSAFDLPLFSSVYVKNGDIFLSAIVTRQGPAKYLDFISGCYRVHSEGVWSGKDAIEQRMMMLESLITIRKVLNRKEEAEAIEKRIRGTMLRVGKLSVKWSSWVGMKKVITCFPLMPYIGHFLAGARLQYIGQRRKIIGKRSRDARIKRKNFRKKIRGIGRRIGKRMPGFMLNRPGKP